MLPPWWAKPMVLAWCVGSASRIASASCSVAAAKFPRWARLETSQQRSNTDISAPVPAFHSRGPQATHRDCRWQARPHSRIGPGGNVPG